MASRPVPSPQDALLVIDVQRDFCGGGSLEVPEAEAIVPIINGLAKHFPCVVFTQDWHPANHLSFASQHPGKAPFDTGALATGEQILWPDHCVQGTPGAEFHADLDTAPAQLVIRKGFRREIDSYSAFYENDRSTATGLTAYLRARGVIRVFLCGLATDVCVRHSALDACNARFETVQIEDASRAIDQDGSLAAALEDMRAAGVKRMTAAGLGT